MPRKPKSVIALDSRTGLPVGISIPGAKPRLPAAREEEEDDESEGEEEGARVNLGAARPRKEGDDEKRQRKQAAKEQKQLRRRDKKQTKLAFTAEKAKQTDVHTRTKQIPATPL